MDVKFESALSVCNFGCCSVQMQSEASGAVGRLLQGGIQATAATATFSQSADQNKGPLAQKNSLQCDKTSVQPFHSTTEI